MLNRITKVICLGLAMTTLVSLRAETLLLRNGTSLEGKILTQNQRSITILQDGLRRVVPKDQLERVIYQRITADEKKENLEIEKRREEIAKLKAAEEELALKESTKQQLLEQKKDEEKGGIPVRPKERKIDKDSSNGLPDFVKSAILPGWGQWSQNRNMMGLLYPTFMIIGGVAVAQKDKAYHNAIRDYNTYYNPYSLGALLGNYRYPGTVPQAQVLSITNPIELYYYERYYSDSSYNQRKKIDTLYQEMRNIGYAIAAVYLINILDAYLFGGSGPFASQAEPEKNGMVLHFHRERVSKSGINPVAPYAMENKYSLGYQISF